MTVPHASDAANLKAAVLCISRDADVGDVGIVLLHGRMTPSSEIVVADLTARLMLRRPEVRTLPLATGSAAYLHSLFFPKLVTATLNY